MSKSIKATIISAALFILSMFVMICWFNFYTQLIFYLLLLAFVLYSLFTTFNIATFNGIALKLSQTNTKVEKTTILSVLALCAVGLMIVFADWIIHFVLLFK